MAWIPPDPPDAQAPAWTPPDPPDAAPTTQGAGDVFREQLQAPIANIPARSREFTENLTRDATELATQDIPRLATGAAKAVGTVPLKQLGGDLGLPVPPITPEDDAAFRDAMINLLTMGAGGAAGGAAQFVGGGIGRSLARGGLSRSAMAQRLGLTGHQTPGVMKNITDQMLPMVTTGGVGAAIGASGVGDELIPGDIPPSQEALAGAGTSMIAGPRIAETVLRNNPAFAQWALSQSGGNPGKLIGLLLASGVLDATGRMGQPAP
jgi:hypothetical protein